METQTLANQTQGDELFGELDDLLAAFDGQEVEGGVDAAEDDDGCAGGACKI